MTSFDYSGQWLGYSDGDPPGQMLLDLDFDKTTGASVGIAYLFSPDPNAIPSSFAYVKFDSEAAAFSIESMPRPFDARNGRILTSVELQNHFKEVQFPDTVTIHLTRRSNDTLGVNWSTSIGTAGAGELVRSRPGKVSRRPSEPTIASWNDCKRSFPVTFLC